ncbi:hypothetical protein [Cysteiniphilum marinum]|uniref:hypothetical protein n=2 Tax=Fastidiosibacteraceae TaxID=2056687 RepID=UPI00193B5F0C|nr:hypothetical protein [Cysteiniphilum marinum]
MTQEKKQMLVTIAKKYKTISIVTMSMLLGACGGSSSGGNGVQLPAQKSPSTSTSQPGAGSASEQLEKDQKGQSELKDNSGIKANDASKPNTVLLTTAMPRSGEKESVKPRDAAIRLPSVQNFMTHTDSVKVLTDNFEKQYAVEFNLDKSIKAEDLELLVKIEGDDNVSGVEAYGDGMAKEGDGLYLLSVSEHDQAGYEAGFGLYLNPELIKTPELFKVSVSVSVLYKGEEIEVKDVGSLNVISLNKQIMQLTDIRQYSNRLVLKNFDKVYSSNIFAHSVNLKLPISEELVANGVDSEGNQKYKAEERLEYKPTILGGQMDSPFYAPLLMPIYNNAHGAKKSSIKGNLDQPLIFKLSVDEYDYYLAVQKKVNDDNKFNLKFEYALHSILEDQSIASVEEVKYTQKWQVNFDGEEGSSTGLISITKGHQEVNEVQLDKDNLIAAELQNIQANGLDMSGRVYFIGMLLEDSDFNDLRDHLLGIQRSHIGNNDGVKLSVILERLMSSNIKDVGLVINGFKKMIALEGGVDTFRNYIKAEREGVKKIQEKKSEAILKSYQMRKEENRKYQDQVQELKEKQVENVIDGILDEAGVDKDNIYFREYITSKLSSKLSSKGIPEDPNRGKTSGELSKEQYDKNTDEIKNILIKFDSDQIIKELGKDFFFFDEKLKEKKSIKHLKTLSLKGVRLNSELKSDQDALEEYKKYKKDDEQYKSLMDSIVKKKSLIRRNQFLIDKETNDVTHLQNEYSNTKQNIITQLAQRGYKEEALTIDNLFKKRNVLVDALANESKPNSGLETLHQENINRINHILDRKERNVQELSQIDNDLKRLHKPHFTAEINGQNSEEKAETRLKLSQAYIEKRSDLLKEKEAIRNANKNGSIDDYIAVKKNLTKDKEKSLDKSESRSELFNNSIESDYYNRGVIIAQEIRPNYTNKNPNYIDRDLIKKERMNHKDQNVSNEIHFRKQNINDSKQLFESIGDKVTVLVKDEINQKITSLKYKFNDSEDMPDESYKNLTSEYEHEFNKILSSHQEQLNFFIISEVNNVLEREEFSNNLPQDSHDQSTFIHDTVFKVTELYNGKFSMSSINNNIKTLNEQFGQKYEDAKKK